MRSLYVTGAAMAALMLVAFSSPAPAAQAQANSAAAEAKLVCKTGPVTRRFGGTLWDVYLCDDGKSLAFQPEKNNPNNSALFILRWKGTVYELEGTEGDNPRVAQKAYDDISDLTERQIAELIAAIRAKG